MNMIKCFAKLLIFTLFQSNIILSAAQGQPCTQVATVIFSQHLAKANISSVSKVQLQQILNNLYLGYLVRQNGAEVFDRSGTDPKMIESYWQSLKNGTAAYDTNPFCLYTALKQNPKDIQDNKICIDTASLQSQPVNVANCQQNLKNMYEACGAYQLILKDFLQQIDPKSFQPIAGADGQWQTNYVTFHLQKAVARLAATSSMVCSGMSCAPKFMGDVRDRGIIVNIQNNTQKDFAIIQSTVDDKTAQQIGMIKPGLNNVNLYLSSLQAPTATSQTASSYKFDVVAMGNNLSNNDQFSIKIMTGIDLLAFLKSINKNPKGLFYMNGRLIAPKYAVDPEGQFLVLIKSPKNQTTPIMAYDKTADQDFPIDQRIQCIALNDSNPYLMTMQINEDEVEYEATKDAKEKSKVTILQPSFFSIQSLPGLAAVDQTQTNATPQSQPKTNSPGTNPVTKETLTNALPPVILPDFLSDNQNLNVYTTILQTLYIAALTDFAFFNQKCFANDMMCYDLLGYFDKQNQRRIVLNFYSLYVTKKEMLEIDEIIECAVFETIENSYTDIPLLYLFQNSKGILVSDDIKTDIFNLNFKLFDMKAINFKDKNYLNNEYFGKKYSLPFEFDLFFKISVKDLEKNIFVNINNIEKNKYNFILKNKDDVVLGNYTMYLPSVIQKIKIEFLDKNKFWLGTDVPEQLINAESNKFYNFKIDYTYNSSTKQYQLHTSAIRPIDKIKIVHTVTFFEYPITDMYLDLYNIYQVSTIYRCKVTENDILPSFLQTLSQDDWKNGVYIITEVKNNNKLSIQHSGTLTVTFYQSDGITKLGQLDIQGKNESTGKIGIIEPVHAYNLGGKSLIEIFDIYLTTGILLKYESNKNG